MDTGTIISYILLGLCLLVFLFMPFLLYRNAKTFALLKVSSILIYTWKIKNIDERTEDFFFESQMSYDDLLKGYGTIMWNFFINSPKGCFKDKKMYEKIVNETSYEEVQAAIKQLQQDGAYYV